MDPIILLRAIISLPIIFFVPGYVTFTAFKVNKTENLKLSFFETIFLQVLTSIVITGLIAFTLAMLGYFSLISLLGLLLAYSITMAIKFKVIFRLSSIPKPGLDKQSLFLILLIILSVLLFFHPSQEIIGRHDIGVYFSTGINIAKTGSILIYDEILENMPQSAKLELYNIFNSSRDGSIKMDYPDGRQFPDFIIADKNKGLVVSIQPPLQQIWLGIFYSIFGLERAGYVISIFGLLAITCIFIIGKTIYGFLTGAIAAFLLTLNFIQIFFSQYSSPEMVFQFLFFCGILSFIFFLRTHNKFFAILSAVCFGELFFVRTEALLVLVIICFIFIYLFIKSRFNKIWLYFIIPFSALFIYFLRYATFFLKGYIFYLFTSIESAYKIKIGLLQTGIIFFVLPVLIFAISLYFLKFRKFRFPTLLNRLPYFLIFILLLFFLYTYLPLLQNIRIWRGTIDPLVSLSKFISPLGIFLAFLGLIFAFFREDKLNYVFLALVLPFIFIFLYTIPNNPVFPWVMRRHITVLIPSFMIFIGLSINKIQILLRTKFLKIIIPIFLILFLSLFSIGMDKTLTKPQFDGFIRQLDEVAEFFDNNSIILDASRYTDLTLSMPLKYIYNKNSIYLWKDISNADIFIEMMKRWNRENKKVYLMVYPDSRYKHLENTLSSYINFELVKIFPVNIKKLNWEWYKFSNETLDTTYPLKVYRLIYSKGE